MDNSQWQVVGKAHMQYSEAKPQWMQLGLRAINRWGNGEVTMQQAVAEALEDAYARGVRGEPPVYEAPAPIGVMRRQRAAPPLPPKIVRRTR